MSLIKSTKELLSKINDNRNFQILSEVNNTIKGNYLISNPIRSIFLQKLVNNKENLSRTWIISQKGVEAEVKVGDIIKLGRVRLKFDKIFLKNTNRVNTTNVLLYPSQTNIANEPQNGSFLPGNTVTNINNSINESVEMSLNNNTEGQNCRICYRGENSVSNPLVSPCKCVGSMKYIHYNCLKKCIEVKLQRKTDENYLFLSWKNFECEICKEEYPKYFKYQNEKYLLVDYDVNFEEYVICDYSLFDDNQKKCFRRGILVFNVEEGEEITIGRTQNNKIKLKDISVSRSHCYIIKKNNKLYIVDKGSKFGTLFYLNKEIYLGGKGKDIFQSINLTTGKYCFSYNITKTWSFFSSFFTFECCQCKNTDIEYIVEDQPESKTKSEKDLFFNNNEIKGINDSYEDYVMDIESLINEINEKKDKNHLTEK